VAVAVALAVVVAGVVVARGVGSSPERGGPRAEGSVTRSPAPAQAVAPDATLAARPACDRVTHGFAPTEISVPGATRGASVITPPRDANGIPGVPPLTSAGKSVFAWDRQQGTRPGDRAGNVLLNAHTWPDGSALGNRLLAALHVGDRLVVRGAAGRLCYRVTERVEVPADTRMYRYYARHGPPRLAILVCSGTRLGPGVWTKRTVWFASPVEGTA
jgi:hypothetical protein